jgi:hypothetical protein
MAVGAVTASSATTAIGVHAYNYFTKEKKVQDKEMATKKTFTFSEDMTF